MTPINHVGVYLHSGHRTDTIAFRFQWQAFLFHLLLNASKSHMGKREY